MRHFILGALLLFFVVMMFVTAKTPVQVVAFTLIVLGGACLLLPEWLAYRRARKLAKKK